MKASHSCVIDNLQKSSRTANCPPLKNWGYKESLNQAISKAGRSAIALSGLTEMDFLTQIIVDYLDAQIDLSNVDERR